MNPKTLDQPNRKGRVPTSWRWDFKFLPVDSQAEGFYHPAAADLVRRERPTIIVKRYAHVRKVALSELARTIGNVN